MFTAVSVIMHVVEHFTMQLKNRQQCHPITSHQPTKHTPLLCRAVLAGLVTSSAPPSPPAACLASVPHVVPGLVVR